jgi:small-conductance mechanosensitive channel
MAQRIITFSEKLDAILAALPSMPADFVDVIRTILSAPVTGRGSVASLLLAALFTVLLFCPTLITHQGALARRVRNGSAFTSALWAAARDAIDLVLSLVIAALGAALVFSRQEPIDQLAVALLWAAVRWRISMGAIKLILRPQEPRLRLALVSDHCARSLTRIAGVAFGLAIVFIAVVPVLLDNGLAMSDGQAAALLTGTLCYALASVGFWLHLERVASHKLQLRAISQAIAITVWLIWTVGVIRLDFMVYHAVFNILLIAWIMIALDRLLERATKPDPGEPAKAISGGKEAIETVSSKQRWQTIIPAVQHSLHAMVGAIAIVVFGRVWVVEILDIVTLGVWHQIVRALAIALGVLVLGYVCYEALKAWTAALFGGRSALGPTEEGEDVQEGTRLGTILPIMSGFIVVATIATAGLIALSELGVNIGPLLAGAGIFGLALSFGSQAIVRDIVSGIFFMIDDAFRIGEYIEAGRHKGTVEKISPRSVRLRHQNGQFHTIPFGQLGAVTNFSRDWATIKFNLRLARDTDIEKARKIAKELGRAMLEDPEIGKEFLLPLKMQGIADIQENAIVCRFKLTAHPAKPTYVQREAVKRLFKAFNENGIAFASSAVLVQTAGGRPVDTTTITGAAAASTFPSTAISPDGAMSPPMKSRN